MVVVVAVAAAAVLRSALTAAAALDVPEIYHAMRSSRQTSFVKGERLAFSWMLWMCCLLLIEHTEIM